MLGTRRTCVGDWNRFSVIECARVVRGRRALSLLLLLGCNPTLDISVHPKLGGSGDARAEAGDSGATVGSDGESTDTGETLAGSTEASSGSVCAVGDECPEPPASAMNACIEGECQWSCLPEYYDLNGLPADGCEAQDQRHDSPESALSLVLPDTEDPEHASNPLNTSGVLYGDETQPLGLPDWYAITTVGSGLPNRGIVACLSVVNFPPDNRVEACISGLEDPSLADEGCGVAVGGGEAACVEPPGDPELPGLYYVRVRRLRGTQTPNRYWLWLRH